MLRNVISFLILFAALPAFAGFPGIGIPSAAELATCAVSASVYREHTSCEKLNCSPFLVGLHENGKKAGFIGWWTDTSPWRTCQIEKQFADANVSADTFLNFLEATPLTAVSPSFRKHLENCSSTIGYSQNEQKMLMARAYQSAARLNQATQAVLLQIAENDRLLGRKPLQDVTCSMLADSSIRLCHQLKACTNTEDERNKYFSEAEGILREASELQTLRKTIYRAHEKKRPTDILMARSEFKRLIGEEPPENLPAMFEAVKTRMDVVLGFNPLLNEDPFYSKAYDLINKKNTKEKLESRLAESNGKLFEKLLQYQTLSNCFDPRFSACGICTNSNYRTVIESTDPLPDFSTITEGFEKKDSLNSSQLVGTQGCVDERALDRSTTDLIYGELGLGLIPAAGQIMKLAKYAKHSASLFKASIVADGTQSSIQAIKAIEACSNNIKVKLLKDRERNICELGQTGSKAYYDYNNCIQETTFAVAGFAPAVTSALLKLPKALSLAVSRLPLKVMGQILETTEDIITHFKTPTIPGHELARFEEVMTNGQAQVKTVLFQENALLQSMNNDPSLLGQNKDLATALSNLHHAMMMDAINANPELKKHLISYGADTKSQALLLNTADPAIIEAYEQAALRTNQQFHDFMNSGILEGTFVPESVRQELARDPLNWFQSGIGQNFEEASRAARANRHLFVPGTQRVARYAQVRELIKQDFIQQKESFNEIQDLARRNVGFRTLLVPGVKGVVLSTETVDVIRKTLAKFSETKRVDDPTFLEAMRKEFRYRFDYSPTDQEILTMRRYYDAHNNLSPSLIPGTRNLPDIEKAEHGVISFDRASMGAQNIAAQMRMTSGVDNLETFAQESRAAERTVTEDVQSWRNAIHDRTSGLTDPLRTGCSGEDCLGILTRPVTDRDLYNIVQRHAGDPNPASTRMTYLERNNVGNRVVPPGDRATWIQKAESLEKELREKLKASLPHSVLSQVTLLVRITPSNGPPSSLSGSAIELVIGSTTTSDRVRKEIAKAVEHHLAQLARTHRFRVPRPPRAVISPIRPPAAAPPIRSQPSP